MTNKKILPFSFESSKEFICFVIPSLFLMTFKLSCDDLSHVELDTIKQLSDFCNFLTESVKS